MVISRVGQFFSISRPPVNATPQVEEELLKAYCRDATSMEPLLLADLDWNPATLNSRSVWKPLTEFLRYEMAPHNFVATAHPEKGDWQIGTAESDEILDALTRISREGRDCPELESAMTWPERLEDLRNTAQPFPLQFGVLRDGVYIVGIAIWWHDKKQQTVELKYWGIVPESREQGWGGALWNSLMQSLKQHPCVRVLFDVDHRNETAIRIYESSGATVIDCFRLWKTLSNAGFSTDYTHS